MRKHAYVVLIKRESLAGSDFVTFEAWPEAEAYFDRASEQWSDSYLLAVVRGPRDVSVPAPVGDLGTRPRDV